MDERRPKNVTAICCFYWFHALFAVAVVVAFPRIFTLCSFTGLGAVATLFTVLGWGLWRLKRWAHRAAIGVSALVLALGLLGLASGWCGLLFVQLLHALVIWQLYRRQTKVNKEF